MGELSAGIDDGGPAFATPPATYKKWDDGEEYEKTRDGQPGMTLRDYFAAKAMASIIREAHKDARTDGTTIMYGYEGEGWVHAQASALEAYVMADAMLAARKVAP
jgi:hypothetical protein